MGVTVSLPNSFANGTTADAGQLMADLNALVSGLGNAVNSAGDTMTGSLVLPNNNAFQGKDTSGNVRNLAYLGGDNAVSIGNSANALHLLSNGTTTINGNNALQALSGGYKVQSGAVSVNVTAGQTVTTTVTYPVAFASALAGFVSVGATTPNTVIATYAGTQTALTIYVYSSYTGTVNVSWGTIGT